MEARSDTAGDASLVQLTGEIDVSSTAALREQLEVAIARRGPVLVDASDCTFLDLASVRLVDEYHRAARSRSVALAFVLPFSAAPVVRRVLLELVPGLASFPIVPDRRSATAVFGLPEREAQAERFEPGRLEAVRARVWEAGWRREGRLTQRDDFGERRDSLDRPTQRD